MNRFIFFLLYFSEGAPIGFIWWAMPSLLENMGFSVTEIATISAVATLPWTLKFIMAPFIDLISMHWLGLKKQLFIYQLLMGVGMFFIPQAMDAKDTQLIIIALSFHGIFAALQDICIDALAIRSIPASETGKINGIMQAGMLVGRSLMGGAGVFIAHKFGLNVLVYFLISCIWISLIALQKTKFQNADAIKVPVKKYLWDFWGLLKRPSFWLLIGMVYFSGFSYNGISTIASAMLSKFGASAELQGLTYSLIIPVVLTLGSLLGGYLSDLKSAAKVLQMNLFFSVVTSIMVGWMYDNYMGMTLLISGYVIFHFFIGSTTASLYGFLMKNTSKEFAALEFSIFMAVVNLCDSSTSYLVGQLVETHTYLYSTSVIGAICLMSLVFIGLHSYRAKLKLRAA